MARRRVGSSTRIHPSGRRQPSPRNDVPQFKFGVQPLTYGLDWDATLAAARAVDRLGFDYLWGHDHLYSTGGDPQQPFFEGWTTLAAWAALTTQARLGLLVGANPFRNPGLVAKMAATVDHISGGRLVLGLGAGNREMEAIAHGIDPGASVGQRLDWLDEALTIVRGLLDGETVDHASERYQFRAAHHAPAPVQRRVPFVVGSVGERKGLRIVARHADIWQMWLAIDHLDLFRHKAAVLRDHCLAMGRDPATIEHTVGGKLVIRRDPVEARRVFDEQMRLHGWPASVREESAWVGTSEEVAAAIIAYRRAGADGFSASVAAPLDLETVEALATQVRPIVDAEA
jgi:alkanesulfonate monooxygenase SsuD/methylene tetrahydromethanopterin reductase-like flavin-dependent oxidoreductase (luciferase family)